MENSGQALLSPLSTTGVVGSDISWLSGMALFSGSHDQSITGTTIALIDNGVSYIHEDLLNNLWDGTNCVSYTG